MRGKIDFTSHFGLSFQNWMNQSDLLILEIISSEEKTPSGFIRNDT